MEENNNYNEKRNASKKLLMTIALVVVAVVLGVGGVYAYFAATVTQDTTSNVSISAVSGLAISFSHSPNLEIENALPGQSWTKTFSATLTNNTSEVPIIYSVKLHITTNTFRQAEGYLQYTLTGAENVNATNIIEQSGDIPIVSNKTIKGSKTTNEVVHTYTLTISYPNNPTSVQNQGGEFNGYVYFETGNNQISGGVKMPTVSGTPKTKDTLVIGDVVSIGAEEFYVIPDKDGKVKDDNGKVRALAKYNLLVGRVCIIGSESSCSEVDNAVALLEQDPTGTLGLQSSKARGFAGGALRVGTIEFSSDTKKGKNYSTYAGSIVETYVNTYVNEILKPIAGDSITGRLILKEEIQELKRYYTGDKTVTIGEENMNNWTIKSGLTQPTWLWGTSYWTGSPKDTSSVWYVHVYGYFATVAYSEPACDTVRPVIVF